MYLESDYLLKIAETGHRICVIISIPYFLKSLVDFFVCPISAMESLTEAGFDSEPGATLSLLSLF